MKTSRLRLLILLTLKLSLNSTKNVKHLSRESKLEVRIMRLRREKGEREKGALQATQNPNVPNNNTKYWYYT